MLKVFLVEDEFVVRQGIKNNIDWNAHGYEFCGEASDGELAYPMIQKLRPDIVITDIKMPFMDGLTLSKLIKKEMPQVEIIILTGHEEFEYAKESIKIGVAEYLLKPISGEGLIKEMGALAAKIEEKKKEREIRLQYQKEMEENVQKDRSELFRYLVTGEKSSAELLELSGKLDLDLSALRYNIVLLKAQSNKEAYDEYSYSQIEAEEAMKKLDDKFGLLSFDRGLEGKALLFRGDSEEELEEKQKDYIEELISLLEHFKGIHYFGGVGQPVNRLGELPLSFEKASHAFAHRYLVAESRILNSAELEQGIYGEKENFDLGSVDPKQVDRSRIQDFLKLGEKGEVVFFVEEFFKDLGPQAMASGLFRQYITMDMYFCVVEFLGGLGLPRDEIETLELGSDALQNKDSAMNYVQRILTKALELRERKASGRYENVVEEVLSYIEKNYADEELSLNGIAANVNFSPNHLSMILSQQTGHTFIKYLTDFRMNKAKELLRCTGKRSSEISLEVGYKDPHYFSYLFKKTQGMTPTEYRGRKDDTAAER